MRDTRMIDVNKYDIFRESISTLKQTSKDDATGTYMTDSTLNVVNFDTVKDKYVKGLGLADTPKSNDALIINQNIKPTFIEFKNGNLNKEVHNLGKKIYDSVFILTDIIGKGISYTRNNVNYILVYNDTKNNNDDPKEIYRESVSRDIIDKTIMGYAKKKKINFGLSKFEGYCLNSVRTYTPDEFESEFLKKYFV